MKKYFLTLALIAGTTLGALSLRAQTATTAPATPPAPPAATLDQRVGALEAYIENTDPTAPLKDEPPKRMEWDGPEVAS